MALWKEMWGRWFAFDSRRNVVIAGLVGAICCGILSWALGQDVNWDLRNYHLYAAHAYLNDRVRIDLAPAGLQSYFPPLADIPYYVMMRSLPAPLVSFLMGLWQGIAFILLAGIAARVLVDERNRRVLVPMLAVAGLTSATFLGGLGNTMGDTGTAPWVLIALYCVLSESVQRRISLHTAMAGLCIGMAVAFKLTNSIYALALAGAVLAGGATWMWRLQRLVLIASLALGVMAAVDGKWFHLMWTEFGNPLLPQFNAWFKSAFATQTMIADVRWLPQSWGERLLWPVIMTLQPHRVSEAAMPQLIWLLVAFAFACWLVRRVRSSAGMPRVSMGDGQRAVVWFVGIAFVTWMSVFSIHRYLTVAEMIAPLALWCLIRSGFPGELGWKTAKWMVIGCSVVGVLGWNTWGHSRYAKTAYRVESPESGAVHQATVLVSGQGPQAWMIPHLPSQYRFIGMGPGFPQGPDYLERARSAWRATPDRIFAILPAADDLRGARARDLDRRLESLRLATSCASKRRWAKWLKLEVAEQGGGRCVLTVRRDKRLDTRSEDVRVANEAAALFATFSLSLEVTGCQRKEAWMGTRAMSYQWCPVHIY